MNRRYQLTLSLTLAAAVVFASPTFAQCTSCGGGQGFVQQGVQGFAQHGGGQGFVQSGGHGFVQSGGQQQFAHGGFGGGGCDSGACNFGYPGGGDSFGGGGCGKCSGCKHGGKCLQGVKDHFNHLKAIQQRDFARNQAWPKPFNCADRQLYFSIWDPMVERGYRANCLLTDRHFDADSNELNQVGIAKVAGIFRNSPHAQKVALVQNSGNQAVVDARLNSLRSKIDQWYGSGSFTEVAATDIFPTQFSGSRVHALNTLSFDETPVPAIPVATGTGSTSDVGN